MKVKIYKCNAKGAINVPASKSYSHRYLIGAMLSNSKCELSNILISKDIQATLSCMSSFGCTYNINNDCIQVLNNNKVIDNPIFDCNESGSTLRFLIPIALTKYESVTFIGSKKLIERGIEVYESIFEKQGIKIIKTENSIQLFGKLKPGHFVVDGSVSSQFITGLLFALPLLNQDSIIEILKPINSKNYIDMTLDVLDKFSIKYDIDDNVIKIYKNQQYKALNISVEADYSNAAFIDAFNYFGYHIEVKGLNENSLQGDKIYKKHFDDLSKSYMTIDIENCIDLGPVLMVFASMFYGAKFIHTKRLKIKESNRAMAIKTQLSKVNVDVEVYEDEVIVNKSSMKKPTVPFDSHNDHRIAMALSMISTRFDIEINDALAIEKSYPSFYKDLESVGVKIDYDK